MKVHYAYRGAKVLYDFLVSNRVTGTFLLPANVCESVPAACREAGVNVRFVDIQADTLCIDEQSVLSLIKDCAGLLMVHTYGTERCLDFFYAQVRDINPDAIIIDDRCLCMPDFEEVERYAGAEADLTLFSLGDKKQVQLGEGGVGVLKDTWRCENVEVAADSMFENRLFRLDDARYLQQKQMAKQHVAKLQAIYQSELPAELQLPMEYNNWRFNIRVPKERKEQILQAMFANGLFASSHYRSLAVEAELTTPSAVCLQEKIINLFLDPKFYTEEQALRTCQIINETLNQV